MSAQEVTRVADLDLMQSNNYIIVCILCMRVCMCVGGLCSHISLCFMKINCLQKFPLILIIITPLILQCTYTVGAELSPEYIYNNTTTTSMLMYKCKV